MILNNCRIGNDLKTIVIEDGKIADVTTSPIQGGADVGGKRVIPGLIDVHTHGIGGMDTMDADFEAMCHWYAVNGTTSFLPTTMTMGYDDIQKVTDAKTDFAGAQILGFHLEGPFIAEQQKGAQDPAHIKEPDVAVMQRFRNVKMITVAPELPNAEAFIREMSKNMVVSVGHTVCDYETALASIDWGVKCLTHTYNAMPSFHHRNPGPIGAAYECGIYAQLITDGIHIAPSVIKATYQMFGADRVVLISDSIRPAKLKDGKYEAGGLPVFLKDGVARLADGTLAGSAATLWDCVRYAVKIGIPFADAVCMATATPAKLLGVNKGVIEAGYDADLLIIDDEMEIDTVIIAGQVFSSAQR